MIPGYEAAHWRSDGTYLRRQDMSSKVSQSKLEASILSIDDDFDGDQGVCGNRPCGSRGGLWR